MRYLTLACANGFLVGSVYMLSTVPGSFLPPEDASRITLSVELPPNAMLEDTDAATTAIYDRVKDIAGSRASSCWAVPRRRATSNCAAPR